MGLRPDGTWVPDYTFGANQGNDYRFGMGSSPMGPLGMRPGASISGSQATANNPFPWMQVGSGLVTAGGLLGSYMTSKNAGQDAMKMSKKMFDMYSNPASDYYRTANRRMNQMFSNATPTIDTYTAANASAGLGSRSSSVISNQLFNQQALKNRQAASGAMQDFWLGSQGNALNAANLYAQSASEANNSQGSFWDNITGGGLMGLLGLFA